MFGILVRFESCRRSKHMGCVFFGWCPMAHGFWRIIYLKLSMSPSDPFWRYPKLVEKKVTRCDNSDVKAVMVDDTKVSREETHVTLLIDTPEVTQTSKNNISPILKLPPHTMLPWAIWQWTCYPNLPGAIRCIRCHTLWGAAEDRGSSENETNNLTLGKIKNQC